jgi:hypothetical protein
MTGTADISSCGQYRYTLTREIPAPMWGVGDNARPVVFVMLNPSTADATEDDPTIRRCLGFAQAWGRTGLIVANLYALRSTDPKALWAHPDPVGPLNDAVLAALAHEHPLIVCAWGANAKPERVRQFQRIMNGSRAKLRCLGTTQAGAPRHPLYVRKDASLMEWPLCTGNGGTE